MPQALSGLSGQSWSSSREGRWCDDSGANDDDVANHVAGMNGCADSEHRGQADERLPVVSTLRKWGSWSLRIEFKHRGAEGNSEDDDEGQ